jgi:S-adenosylhomocysteine hydrolase
MSTINTEEITVTLKGIYNLLTEEQKDSLKKLFILINARHKILDEDIKIHYYNIK